MLPPLHIVGSILAVLALLSSVAAHAQSSLRIEERLVPVPGTRLLRGASQHAFLGIWSEGEFARLSLYDDTLAQRATSASYGLRPLDALWQPAIARALVLASPLDDPALFTVPIDAPPEQTLVWRGAGAPLRRIVATGDFDRDGVQEAALVGDSAFVIVRLDGIERLRVARPMIDAHHLDGSPGRFILVWRDGPDVAATHFDARTARAGRPTLVPLAGEVMTCLGTGEQPRLALASRRAGTRAWLVDLFSDAAPRPYPIAGAAVALVPHDVEGRSGIAALVRSTRGPQLIPLDEEVEPHSIDYPLPTVFDRVAASRGFVALIAPDSTAVYTRAWELVGRFGSPGVESPRLSELGERTLLLATTGGSSRMAIVADETPWLMRHWPWLLAGLAAALAIGAIVAIAMRYSLVQSIYFNLVGVPSSHGVIVLSRTQRVEQMNGSARELLGISSYIPLGRHILEYLGRDELRGVVASLRRLFSDGEGFEQRLDVDTGNGVRALTFRGRTMLTRSGFRAGYLLLVEDVTRTIAQERLVNWASVAHHIAHEMKTPLGTVRMTAELLRDRLSSNGRDEEYLRATSRIVKQSERLREIVDDLLTVARTETLQKTRADVALLLGSLAHDYRDYLPPNVELEVTIRGEDHRCQIDVQQVTVALRNLLDNARHAVAARDGGRIAVSLDAGEHALTLTVEDNGVGMRPETLARLFQPFYTEREGGSGIGTVIIKRVFEAHGGMVEVTSSLGVGTRFTVTLPKG